MPLQSCEAESLNCRRSNTCHAGRAQVEQADQDVRSQAKSSELQVAWVPDGLKEKNPFRGTSWASSWLASQGRSELSLENEVIPGSGWWGVAGECVQCLNRRACLRKFARVSGFSWTIEQAEQECRRAFGGVPKEDLFFIPHKLSGRSRPACS